MSSHKRERVVCPYCQLRVRLLKTGTMEWHTFKLAQNARDAAAGRWGERGCIAAGDRPEWAKAREERIRSHNPVNYDNIRRERETLRPKRPRGKSRV